MNALPDIVQVLDAFRDENLETVLVGMAAAALQGAPVTTDDFDFAFRETPRNVAKLKRVAGRLNAQLSRPYYPSSRLYRLTSRTGAQVDMMPSISGFGSFESLRSHSIEADVEGRSLRIASLAAVIKSKKITNRSKDRAVMPVLEETLREKEKT